MGGGGVDAAQIVVEAAPPRKQRQADAEAAPAPPAEATPVPELPPASPVGEAAETPQDDSQPLVAPKRKAAGEAVGAPKKRPNVMKKPAAAVPSPPVETQAAAAPQIGEVSPAVARVDDMFDDLFGEEQERESEAETQGDLVAKLERMLSGQK